jgi:hypothetical protein
MDIILNKNNVNRGIFALHEKYMANFFVAACIASCVENWPASILVWPPLLYTYKGGGEG